MKLIENELETISKKISGKLSTFGTIYEKVLNAIEKNKLVINCDLISEYSFSFKKESSELGKTKKFNIKKIRKIYKKKQLNNIIINLDEFDRYKKTLIKDSIYISNGAILYSENEDYDFDRIIKMYNRYKTSIEVIECQNGKIVIADLKEAKNKHFREKFYYIADTFYSITEMISNFIIN